MKKIIVTSAIVLHQIIVFAQTGLIGSYPFNGNANDASGSGNNGVVNGATLTADRYGNSNSAYSFNGVGNYIDLGTNFAYTSHSFSAWCKKDGTGNNLLISKLNNGPYDTKNSELSQNGFTIGSGTAWQSIGSSNPTPYDGYWCHVVGTFDASTNKVKMYFNGYAGSYVDSAGISGYFDVNGTSVFIGARPYWSGAGGPAFFYKGAIDDVNIYNRVLSKHEVDSLYNPCTMPVSISGTSSICQGNSATLNASGGTSYAWSNGATTSSIIVSPTTLTSYSVTGFDSNYFCYGNGSTTVTINSVTPIVNAIPSTICEGNSATLNASGGTSYIWYNGATTTSIVVSPTSLTIYSVTVTDGIGCSQSGNISISVNALPSTPTVMANMSVLASSSSTGNQWYLNGNPISGATSQFYTVLQNGFYTVCVTDANSCSSCSTPYNFSTTGIADNHNANDIVISQNPNNGIFTIYKKDINEISIYNVFGERIYLSTQQLTNSLIDISSQPSGVYFIQVKTKDGVGVKKIIIQN